MITKSKKIWIYRVEKPTLPGLDSEDRIMRIGSAFAGKGSSDVLRGLTPAEELKYLPSILGIAADDNRFPIEAKKYWASLSVDVPSYGLELEVGKQYANEEDAKNDKNGIPIHMDNYILYRYCLVYGRVANTPADIKKAPLKINFWIKDEEVERKTKQNILEVKKEAMTAAAELAKDPNKLEYVLWLEKRNIPGLGLPNLMDTIDKETILFEELLDKRPEVIVRYAKDKLLATKAFIMKAVEFSIVKIIPNTEVFVYDSDSTSITLGDNLKEAALYLDGERGKAVRSELEVKIKANPRNLIK